MARLRFLIGGVQKGGTSALARFLSTHPAVRLPAHKEAHVFDACDYDETWNDAAVDRRFAAHFGPEWNAARADLHFGDATPITIFHPRLIERAYRYRPDLRWIVLLREPAERAISHWHMQRQRGSESWPLWAALLLERWRLAGHEDDFAPASPLRDRSYLARGDYARQLDALYARFPPEQVLLIRNHELANTPETVMPRVYAHLGLPAADARVHFERVFESGFAHSVGYGANWRLARWLLRRQLADLRARYGIDWPDRDRSSPSTGSTP
jgi:hypothetical protein